MYVQLGTMLCGAPLTVAECQEAASKLGKGWEGSENVDDFPAGCYIFEGQTMYFNKHPTGKAHSRATRVFKKQAGFKIQTGCYTCAPIATTTITTDHHQ